MPVTNEKASRIQIMRRRATVRIVITSDEFSRYFKRTLKKLAPLSRKRLEFKVYANWHDIEAPPARRTIPTVFVSRVADIPEHVPDVVRKFVGSKYLLFAKDAPVEAIASRLPQLAIRDSHRLHVTPENNPRAISDLMFRLLNGITETGKSSQIVDAWLEKGALVLLSPSFDRLNVPLEKLNKFIGTDLKKIQSFEIDEDGSFIHWPHANAHFGWNQFKQLIDPASVIAAEQKTTAFNKRYGAGIRSLREKYGLKQSDIQGITDRHLRRIELGQLFPSKASLAALAKAHKLPLDAYLDEVAKHLRLN